MIKSLSILFLVMTLVACKKDKLKDGKYLLLAGKWNWTHSTHDYGWCDNQTMQEVLTPLTEEKNYAVEFRKNGKIIFFEDYIVTASKRIIFSNFDENESNGLLFEIALNNKDEDLLLGGGNSDTIWLTFPYKEPIEGCGVYVNFFVKE
jgi:hypothetical protein